MYFVDVNIGYAEDWYYSLVKTTNGGTNWFTVNNLGSFYKLYFINGMNGFGGGTDIIRTTDGGDNWVSCTGTGLFLKDLVFVNNNTGFAVGASGNILKTTNAGLNWQFQSSGTNEYLESVKFINENTGYTVGYRTILKTTNSGHNWMSYNIGNYSLISVDFSDLNTGFTSGLGGYTFKTIDGGISWFTLNSGIWTYLTGVYFPSNSTHGYCIGGQGTIMSTSNGGNNWLMQYSGVALNLNALFFIDDNNGYITCDSGKILKTINGGGNWTIQNTETSYNFYGIYFSDINTGFISGAEGSLFKTTNGGANWTSIFSGVNSSLNSIDFVGQNTGFIAGGNHVIKTTNGGNSWIIQYVNSGSYCNFRSMHFLSSLTGYVAGDKQDSIFPYNVLGIVIKTTDGGNSWNRQLGFNGRISSIKFTNFSVGYIARSSGVSYTTNGGNNWILYNCINGLPPLYSIYFIGEDTGYIVGHRGTILKTFDAGGIYVDINNKFNSIPSPSLSQNYPNPFNPVTKIKYDVPKSSLVKIIIYDVLGREIETLVNEGLKPGSYEVTWDGSRYASGVYFYKLMTDEYAETKKMVLIK